MIIAFAITSSLTHPQLAQPILRTMECEAPMWLLAQSLVLIGASTIQQPLGVLAYLKAHHFRIRGRLVQTAEMPLKEEEEV